MGQADEMWTDARNDELDDREFTVRAVYRQIDAAAAPALKEVRAWPDEQLLAAAAASEHERCREIATNSSHVPAVAEVTRSRSVSSPAPLRSFASTPVAYDGRVNGLPRYVSSVGMGDIRPEATSTVAARLLESSTMFARSAATAYSSESWEVFHLHLATAVEQLVKAVLARAHPSFIADTRADFDSLLHLCGWGDRARTPEFVAAVRTITAFEALKRIERVADDYHKPGSRVLLLLETRNSIVHAGHQAKTEGEVILGEVAEYVGPLLSSLSIDPTEYWGDSSEMVADHAKRRLSATEARYERRVQAAKDVYTRTIATMDDVSRVAYLAAVAPTAPSEPFESVPAACPACGHLGLLAGSPDPDWEADWDVADGVGYVAGAYVSAIQLTASGFDCRACGLTLDASLLTLAGLDDVTLREDDFDVSEATTFFQRQLAEEEWGDY